MKIKNKKRRIIGASMAFWLLGGQSFLALLTISTLFFSGSSLAQAFSFDRATFKDFRYSTGTLNYLERIDLNSLVNQPLKIPFTSQNPEQIPGGDQDWLIVHPPVLLNQNATIPLRVDYLSSGPDISREDAQFVQEVGNQINTIANNNPVLIEIVKNLLERNLQVSVKDESSLLSLLFQKVKAADTTDNSLLLTSSEQNSLGLTNLDTTNPQVRQLLMVMFLLLLNNRSLATSVNLDETDCVNSGGQWVNGACQNEQTTLCQNNGGIWKKFTNQCLADRQFCTNSGLSCTGVTSTDPFYGCACKTGSCIDEQDGSCIPRSESKRGKCEGSKGTWQERPSSKEVCLQQCDTTEADCASASTSDYTQSYDSNFYNNGNDNSSASLTSAGCKCPVNKCLSSAGECIAKDVSKLDDDKDGVNNTNDRCPNTPAGETANNVEGNVNRGCSCSQLQSMGKIAQPQCPPDGCESNYLVKYDRSALNNMVLCQSGVIQQQNTNSNSACPVISRYPEAQCNQNNNQNQNQNSNLEDLLKKMMQDKNKKKDQGKQNQGGGNGGNQGNPSQQQQQQQPQGNTNNNNDLSTLVKKQETGNDPSGVGAVNAEIDRGSAKKPFILHVSQFTKICNSNTYVLTNAKAAVGKFRNKPVDNKQAASSGPNKFKGCGPQGCPVDKNARDQANKVIDSVKDWSKYSKETVDKINELVKTDKPDNNTAQTINNLLTNGAASTSTGPQLGEAGSMLNVGNGDVYFKVPECKELASCHCCACGCCEKGKPDGQCGWALGKDCKEGKCTGAACLQKTVDKCQEKQETTIQLDFGTGDVFKCSNEGSQAKTIQDKCKTFQEDKGKNSFHNGICNYDCGAASVDQNTGCGDKKYSDCEIIIPSAQNNPVRFNVKGSEVVDKNDGGTAKFTNHEKGSLLQAQPNSWADGGWVKELEDKEGTCCKCMAEKDVKQPGNAKPTDDIKNDPLWDTWDEGVTPPVKITPNTVPPIGQVPNAGTTSTDKISDDQRNEILKRGWSDPERQDLINYENLRNKEKITTPPTFEDMRNAKQYNNFLDNSGHGWIYKYVTGPTFTEWKTDSWLKEYQRWNPNYTRTLE